MNATEIEIAVSRHFGWQQNLIVPNVSYGLLPYEADLVILRPSGYAIEIEIKTSASDIKADLRKRRHHDSNLFRELWFAVPAGRLEIHPDIPERAGILTVATTKWGHYKTDAVRRGILNRSARRWTPEQCHKLAHLGCMRVWSLKEARWRDRYMRRPRIFVCCRA